MSNPKPDLHLDEMNDLNVSGGRRKGGSKKRRGNASLRAWVTFVKKVQKEENISYKEAMMRAKKRKDKGEKWRGGGYEDEEMSGDEEMEVDEEMEDEGMEGGKRRRKTRRRRSRKSRGRKSRRHR